MEFFSFENVFFKSKQKIFILSKNVRIRICRIYLKKQFRTVTFFPYLEYFVQEIEFFSFKSVFFFNPNKKYSSYQKMCEFKFVESI